MCRILVEMNTHHSQNTHQKLGVLCVEHLSSLVGSSPAYSHSPPRRPLLLPHWLKSMQIDSVNSKVRSKQKVTQSVISEHNVHHHIWTY